MQDDFNSEQSKSHSAGTSATADLIPMADTAGITTKSVERSKVLPVEHNYQDSLASLQENSVMGPLFPLHT